MRFRAKKILVTGAASGIGLACVERFIDEGGQVVGVDINEALGQAAFETFGPKARFLRADVADAESVGLMMAAALEFLGGIDVCVCAAGVAGPPAPFIDVDVAQFDRVMAINVRGAFLVGQAAARHMVETGRRGSVIHMSSVGAVLAVGNSAPYCVSKAALGMLTKAMAVSLAPQGIRVNAVGPGPTNTALTTHLQSNTDAMDMMLSRTPLGRFAEASEMAAVTLFLASEEASFVTGQTIYADGGRLALNYTMPPKAPAKS
jgi:glucose 1-dehydrogenase